MDTHWQSDIKTWGPSFKVVWFSLTFTVNRVKSLRNGRSWTQLARPGWAWSQAQASFNNRTIIKGETAIFCEPSQNQNLWSSWAGFDREDNFQKLPILGWAAHFMSFIHCSSILIFCFLGNCALPYSGMAVQVSWKNMRQNIFKCIIYCFAVCTHWNRWLDFLPCFLHSPLNKLNPMIIKGFIYSLYMLSITIKTYPYLGIS